MFVIFMVLVADNYNYVVKCLLMQSVYSFYGQIIVFSLKFIRKGIFWFPDGTYLI